MNKIAIYLRLSEEDYHKVDESESIANQRDYIKSYIENETSLKRCEIEEYVDDGYSATNTNRPSFLRLIEDIKSGKAVSYTHLHLFNRSMNINKVIILHKAIKNYIFKTQQIHVIIILHLYAPPSFIFSYFKFRTKCV